MIGLDTKVLVRYLTQDDPARARIVDLLVDGARTAGVKLRVDDIVLCELVWVLRAAYRIDKAAIVVALERMAETALFSFEDPGALRRAVEEFRDGDGDFADYLIGLRNQRAGCERTMSFDRALAGCPSFEVL